MEFRELLNYIMLLPAEQKAAVRRMLNSENLGITESYYKTDMLRRTPEWKEIETRAVEIFKNEKQCLVHFDDHLTSINN